LKILIINVALRPNSPIKYFPIGLGYIATAIKNAGYDFDLLDIDAHRYSGEYVEKFIRRSHYDIICMGCIVTGYKIIKELTLLIRTYQPHAKIVVGNSVATSIPEILLTRTESDIAILGEGD
jgi:anaerobic magnesium-protoporphyrin IX monomethyl ester cyclase